MSLFDSQLFLGWHNVIFAFSFVTVSEVTIIKQVSVGSVQIQSEVFVRQPAALGQCFNREWPIFAQ